VARQRVAVRLCDLKRFSSSALVTTEKLENAIAAPAKIGVRSPNAASGIPITL
jgi:hypothetical protein